MSCQIINHLKGIENYSYLELGVFDNKNFESINAKTKFSVDLNGRAKFTGTTDQYFEQLHPDYKFDIIFIDANHDYDFVLRDYNNSILHCNKWILIHDMIPPIENYTAKHLCSDSYKLLYYFMTEENFQIYPMGENYGLTLIRLPAKQVFPSNEITNISYWQFVEYINNKKLYYSQEIIEMLRNENV